MQLLSTIFHLLSITSVLAGPIVIRRSEDRQSKPAGSRLNATETRRHLEAGAEILGEYKSSDSHLANWIGSKSDNLSLTELNLPGCHDCATWNYSSQSVGRIAEEANVTYAYTNSLASSVWRCQTRSLFQMLNDGLRAFDLRIGYDTTNGVQNNDTSILRFYHSTQMMSTKATVADVFYGFYHFLDQHPSETLFISVKVDVGTNDAALQAAINSLQTTGVGRDFWLQQNAIIPTLGEARGRILFLNRIGNAHLPVSKQIGLDMGPDVFSDNLPDFKIVYNANISSVIKVEDYYTAPNAPKGPAVPITWKYNATIAHIDQARSNASSSSDLFITFASAYANTIGVYPEYMALGVDNIQGVNHRLLQALKKQKDGRRGVVLLDWYHQVPGLVEAVIGQ